jgi:4-hydroxy-3-polyprenylbenzoate decarboxylase
MQKIVIGVAGSSGALYAQSLLDKLSVVKDIEVGVVMSENAIINWELEVGSFDASVYPFRFYDKRDFNAPFASGSAQYESMVICPCSMGVLGRVASGVSDDLMSRAADVVLKERRKLILVTRETPLSLIHINNMKTVTEAGGIVLPATPSFYSNPTTIDEVISTVTDRIVDMLGLDIDTYRWGS